MQELRDLVRETIRARPTTARNATMLERVLFESVDESEYEPLAYTILGWVREPNSDLKAILAHVKAGQDVWHLPLYDTMRLEEDLENDRKTRPTKIVDGIYKCGKCKCRKVATYSVQTRGGDEAMTHFFTCVQCGNKWRTG